MEYDSLTTGAIFVAIVVIGVVGTIQTPMTTQSVLMMVLPSMVVFGAIMLFLGVKHGEYRSKQA